MTVTEIAERLLVAALQVGKGFFQSLYGITQRAHAGIATPANPSSKNIRDVAMIKVKHLPFSFWGRSAALANGGAGARRFRHSGSSPARQTLNMPQFLAPLSTALVVYFDLIRILLAPNPLDFELLLFVVFVPCSLICLHFSLVRFFPASVPKALFSCPQKRKFELHSHVGIVA